MSATPVISKAMFKNMSREELKKLVSDPAKLAEMNAFLQSPEGRGVVDEIVSDTVDPEITPDPEVVEPVVELDDAAKVEADRVAAEQQITQNAILDEAAKAEAEALLAAGITVYKDVNGSITKIVQDYQVDDGHGNPVGRPTHLEAYSWPELSRKQREAHTHATRAFSRLKDQKTTFKKPEPVRPASNVPLLSDEDRIQAALDLNSDDENVVIKADRKLRADQILRDQKKETEDRERARQKAVSDEFKIRHQHDFNPCQANAGFIGAYIADNKLEWTTDNLELAFAATEPQLVPVQAPVVEETTPVAANPQEVSTVVEPVAPAAVILPPPAATAVVPAAPAVAANPQPPARRPGVNASLQPGQPTGQRPVAAPVGLTMKDIWNWKPEQMRKERQNPARRAEIDRVIAAYNKAKASRV
jgi:hypothetical protein